MASSTKILLKNESTRNIMSVELIFVDVIDS